jgi:type IV pilus assembly protein PilV
MLKHKRMKQAEGGFSLLEVLVTMLLVAFGLLGLAAMETRMMNSTNESFQRSQAVAILSDMTARMKAAGTNAGSYVTTTNLGTGNTTWTSGCGALAVGPTRDQCEWSSILQGAGETSSGGKATGAMVNAVGCISTIQAPNPASGICKPGIYDISVAWQGLSPTVTNSGNTCGTTLYTDINGTANDNYRRLITARVVVPQNACN